MDLTIIFSIAILVVSVVIHEVAHGYAALWQGDVTAKYAGRLTLNPLKHLDMFGSVILPILCSLIPGGIIIGWAKPVPYNPYNLKNQRWGELIVAIAGPVSNILIAVIFGIIFRFSQFFTISQPFLELSFMVIIINLVLAFFNLMPIPPLDGSKILFSVVPISWSMKLRFNLERFSIILLLFLLFVVWPYFSSFIFILAKFIAGF